MVSLIATASQPPAAPRPIAPAVAVSDTPEELEKRLEAAEAELAELEDVIATDPAAAVRITLLADEIDGLSRRLDDLAAEVDRQDQVHRADVARLEEWIKWGIGGIVLAVVAILLARALAERKGDRSTFVDLRTLLGQAGIGTLLQPPPAPPVTSTRRPARSGRPVRRHGALPPPPDWDED